MNSPKETRRIPQETITRCTVEACGHRLVPYGDFAPGHRPDQAVILAGGPLLPFTPAPADALPTERDAEIECDVFADGDGRLYCFAESGNGYALMPMKPEVRARVVAFEVVPAGRETLDENVLRIVPAPPAPLPALRVSMP